MSKKVLNKNLHLAKKAKNDEFYTREPDVTAEITKYYEFYKDKIILCNCNDARSEFYHVLKELADLYGIKKIIATSFGTKAYKLEYENGVEKKSYLIGDGDFSSDECVDLLKECDIVITNPPFSLFRRFLSLLVEYDKKFLIIGSMNAITYKDVFKLIKENKVWLGMNNPKIFSVDEDYSSKNTFYEDGKNYAKFGNICWFTNLMNKKRTEGILLYQKYTPEKYPKYDNYDAINVDKTIEIPTDYDGVMGVPITFLDKHNPEQFELLGLDNHLLNNGLGKGCNSINGNKIYRRIIIQKRRDK